MIADLVVTVVIYREGGHFQAICPEFGVEATGQSSGDAKEEVLAAVRRHLDGIAFRGQLADYLAEAGFVDIDITPTHEVAPGMHSAIVRARKPRE